MFRALSLVSLCLLESVTKMYELFHETRPLFPWRGFRFHQNAFTCNHAKVASLREKEKITSRRVCLRARVEGATIEPRSLKGAALARVWCLLYTIMPRVCSLISNSCFINIHWRNAPCFIKKQIVDFEFKSMYFTKKFDKELCYGPHITGFYRKMWSVLTLLFIAEYLISHLHICSVLQKTYVTSLRYINCILRYVIIISEVHKLQIEIRKCDAR